MIGDKAFNAYNQYKFAYDLGAIWKQYTGMPFVFAVWAANKKISDAEKKKVSDSLKLGMDSIEKVIHIYQPKFPAINLHQYLTENISFDFDREKKKSMNFFLQSSEISLPMHI